MSEAFFGAVLFPAFIGFQSLFSGFFVFLGYSFYRQWRAFKSQGVETVASIVDAEPSELDSGGITWFPVVAFQTGAGIPVKAKSTTSTHAEPALGERIRIVYLSDDPEAFTPKRQLTSWLGFGLAAWIIPCAFFAWIISKMPPHVITAALLGHLLGFVISKKLDRR